MIILVGAITPASGPVMISISKKKISHAISVFLGSHPDQVRSLAFPGPGFEGPMSRLLYCSTSQMYKVHACPIPNHSSGVLAPSTMERTTCSALEKSGNKMCGMFSLLQYVARSFSPSDFDFTKSTSACFAADMSTTARGIRNTVEPNHS